MKVLFIAYLYKYIIILIHNQININSLVFHNTHCKSKFVWSSKISFSCWFVKLWIQRGLPYHSYYLVLSKSKNLSPTLCCIFAEENLDHLP